MYCYRFPSEEEFLDLAAAEGLVNEDGALIAGGYGRPINTPTTFKQ